MMARGWGGVQGLIMGWRFDSGSKLREAVLAAMQAADDKRSRQYCTNTKAFNARKLPAL